MNKNDPTPQTRRASLGEWLTSKMGLQRMMLERFNQRSAVRPGELYRGTSKRPAQLAKRRAKNKVAKRSRAINRKVAKR